MISEEDEKAMVEELKAMVPTTSTDFQFTEMSYFR
jgi:hypothetical protein